MSRAVTGGNMEAIAWLTQEYNMDIRSCNVRHPCHVLSNYISLSTHVRNIHKVWIIGLYTNMYYAIQGYIIYYSQ